MNIPTNNYNDAPIVEKLTNQILSRMEKNGYTYGAATWYGEATPGQATLRKVLDQFKAKGYHCYYQRRFDGVWLNLRVYNYDYQPRNGGLNKLIKY